MAIISSICVYCGSRRGAQPGYSNTAQQLGQEIAKRGMRLVYGGGQVGLMGVVADSVLESGGEVIGVIPDGLAVEEVMHQEVADMRIVPDMHRRKGQMHELSDAYIALPGGVGTFEELFEVFRDRPEEVPENVRARFEEAGPLRATADYVAGMTDRYVALEHERLAL